VLIYTSPITNFINNFRSISTRNSSSSSSSSRSPWSEVGISDTQFISSLSGLQRKGSVSSKVNKEWLPQNFDINNEILSFDCAGKMVVRKIWQSLTYHLNTVIEGKVNLALRKRPLTQIIGNNQTLAKYE